MDVRVVDQGQLAAASPEDVAGYLAAHGWSEVYRDAGGAAWATNALETPSGPEIWVPRLRTMRGFINHVAEIIDSLGDFEQRSPTDILFDIVYSMQDIQQLRSFPDLASGEMPLDDSPDVVAGIRKWIASAAGSAAAGERLPVLSGRPAAVVERFMEQVRLVTPAPGSFTWRVAVPLAAKEGLASLPYPDSESRPELATFNRRVTRQLYESTAAALKACAQVRAGAPVLESFQAAVESGVTANLCEGLAGAGGERKISYEVSFNWASSLPMSTTETMRFDVGDIEIVSQAAEEFRRTAPETDVELRGYIVRLSRESDQRPGSVTLAGTATGDADQKFGHFGFELTSEDYSDALASHADHRLVTVIGDVVRRGNRRYLENVRGFRILGEASAEETT